MRRTATAALLALLVLPTLWACDDVGDTPSITLMPFDRGLDGPLDPDADLPDLAPLPDAAPGDMAEPVVDMAPAPDAAPLSPGELCDPCRPDGSCAEGGLCLTNQSTMEQFCGSPCFIDADCPRGATCFDLGDGSRQCVPVGATCDGFPPSDQGAPCVDDDGCRIEADRCVDAAEADYCSVECAVDSDCPPGFERCFEGLCRAVWELGPEGCGRDPGSPLPPCGDGCGDGLTCAAELLDALPSTVAPFCTRACAGDADCPAGTRCAETGGGSICLDTRCDCLARPADQRLLDDALALAGVDRCSAGFDREMFALLRPDVAHDPFRLSFTDPAHRYGYGGLEWARGVQASLADAAEGEGPLATLIARAAALVDAPIDDVPLAYGAAGETPLVDVLADLGAERAAAEEALADVPPSLRRKAARVLRAAEAVAVARARIAGESGLDDDDLEALHRLVPGTMIVRPDFATIDMRSRSVKQLLDGGFDLAPLLAAGRDLAATIEAIDWDAERGAVGFEARVETDLGPVFVHDARVQTLDEDVGGALLVLDVGGDDIYRAPVGATATAAMPVAVVIELDGDDRYGFAGDDAAPDVADLAPADAAGRYDGSHPQVGDAYGPISRSDAARQGAGILGVGLVWDAGGDDTRLSHRLSQGAGVLGLGVLFDGDGRDTYICEQGCQGAGSYGVGLLVDRGAGDDDYLGVQSVQGFAYVRALGYLHDEGGNDDYRALFGDPELGGAFLYPNAQNATSNTSLAQGAGFGRRADFTDQVFASGGLGVFRDGGLGSDRYQVDVFGQGTGFWFGTGLFSDGGGDDIYEGRWYVQGSGAHFAMSFFFEEGGDDVYNRPETIIATATGQGHDMSLGWLVDFAGDDTWTAPGLGLGAGNDNGIGFFLELGGADTYTVPDGRTFGGAAIGDRGAAFENALCLGVFVDADGLDTYAVPDDAPMSDDNRWRWEERRPDHKPGERGAGIDVSGGAIAIP